MDIPLKIGPRAARAAVALQPLGLSLILGQNQFIITDNPDGPADTSIVCTSIEQVEAFIAERTAPKQRKPRVGDIVHYVSYGTPGGEYGRECRAAIVTEVTQVEVNEQNPAGDGIHRQTVGLCVLNPAGQFFIRGVLFHEGHKPDADEPSSLCKGLCCHGGTWHWASHE